MQRAAIAVAIANAAKVWLDSLLAINTYYYDDDDDTETVVIHTHSRLEQDQPIRTPFYVENVVLRLNSRQFQYHFRMTTEAFDCVLTEISTELQSAQGRSTIDAQKQLLAVLWLLATPDLYRSVGDRFDLANASLHRAFLRVTHALNNIALRIICWPQEEQIQQVTRQFNTAGLENVIGCIDGCYIPIKAPTEDPESYICRKRFHAITLQAICLLNLRFSDCFVGYPSSVHDSRIFKNSDIFRAIQNNHDQYFPNDEYIIGDKAYPLKRWCITPYTNRGNLTQHEKNFNTVQAQTRQAIERAFALLKGRFRRLKYLDKERGDLIPEVILSCCVLHNSCLGNVIEDLKMYNNNENIVDVANDNQAFQGHPENDFIEEAGMLKRDRIALALPL